MKTITRQNRLWLAIQAACIYGAVVAPTMAQESDDIYQQLKKMSLDELVQVETRLDETFDVFDSLVKSKRVKVATGDEQSTARAPAVTSVITAQDIEAMGAADIDEVLRSVPGLHVSRSNYLYDPIYTMRGMYSTFNPEVLMLINGIPINHLDTGGRSTIWGGMPVHNISRIEVIRGPGSAVYGADAFAGVINVITKTAKEIGGTEAGARTGSFHELEGWALHGGQYGDFDVAASVEYFDNDGHKKIIQADDQTNFDRQFGTHASLAPDSMNLHREGVDARFDVGYEKWRLRGGYQGRYDLGVGPGSSQTLVPTAAMQDERWNTDLTWHDPKLTPFWDVTAQVSFYDTHLQNDGNRQLYPPGTARRNAAGQLVVYPNGIIINPSFSERHTRAEFSAFYSGIEEHLLRFGVGYHYGDFYEVKAATNTGIDPRTGKPIPPNSPPVDVSDTPYSLQEEGARANWHGFVQDTWSFAPSWELTAGVRYDYYSDFGSTVNPRLALVKQFTPDLTGKLLYGRAFRSPAFRELHIINNPVAQGNPDLEPEKNETLEWALDWRVQENLHLAGNVFYYEVSDKILYQPDPGKPTNTAQNSGSLTSYGMELEARWKVTNTFSLLGNYAYQNTREGEHDVDAGNAPHHKIYLRGDWLLYPEWYLDAQVNGVYDRNRMHGDPRPPVEDYTTLDLTLRYKQGKPGRWNLAFGARNVFDADVYEPSEGPTSDGRIRIPYDLPQAGRTWFTEARYRF